MKRNGVKYSLNSDVIARRRRVMESLSKQLALGTKRIKDGSIVPLTEHDVNRIEREIKILDSRLVHNTTAKLNSRATR